MLTGTQKRRGFREVLFNHKTNGFYAPLPGDNYEVLPIQSGDGGTVSTFGTGDINLETPTVTVTSLPDTAGLQTQQDFNIWAVAALESLASSGDGGGGGGVGTIAEVLAEGSEADPAQRLKFKVSEANLPYELPPAQQEVIDIDGRFGSRIGAVAGIWQVNEPFSIDTDGWDGVYQRGVGNISAQGLSANGLYQTGGGNEYFVWSNYGLGGAFLSIVNQDPASSSDDNIDLNLGISGLALNTPNLKIQDSGRVEATEFVGDGSKLTLTSPNGTVYNLSVADDGTLSATPA